MMPTPEKYRRYAEMCSKMAEKADDKIERSMLVKMAQQWRRLANYKAKRAQEDSTREAAKAAYFSLCGVVCKFILAKCASAPSHNLRLLSSPRCASSTMCLARASLTARASPSRCAPLALIVSHASSRAPERMPTSSGSNAVG